jgi:hypothetical protein
MFRVEWVPAALNDLMDMWADADSELRKAITAASNALDDEMQADPLRLGEGRVTDFDRVVFIYPLAVYFEVDLHHQTVWVLGVWRIRRRTA